MSAARSKARRRVATRRAPQPRALTPAELAWAAALPCALATVAAIVLLGPPLGDALLAPSSTRFWPAVRVAPEPTEHARYLIALLGPALLGAAVLAGLHRGVAAQAPWPRRAIVASQLATVALLVLCMLAQRDILLHAYVPGATFPNPLFSPATLVVSALLTAAGLLGARRPRVRELAARAARDSRARTIVCALLAGGLTALWLSTALNTDATIGHAKLRGLIPWDMSETFAVLDGRTPLVDFHAQYSQLLPYLSAAIMAGAGSSALGAWTAIMLALSGVALLAVYAVLRRVVRSSPVALALYLPFLATGFFVIWEPYENRGSPAGIFSTWPMRYAGPYLLLWLTARHVGGDRPRRAWLLLLAAGLVAINNIELGAGAFAATLAALACHRPPTSWPALGRLAGSALGGLAGAAVLVALATLVRAGELPHFSYLLEFPRLYGVDGWVLYPMTPLGFHLVLYLTFAAALVVAVVRAAAGREPLLTSALAWSGVFGAVAGSYFVGRSDYLNLIALFSAWALALTLLLVAVARALAVSARRPSAPEVAVVFGFALAVCSLAQVPTPWSQLERLHDRTATPRYARPALRTFVARATDRGEHVLILMPLGDRIAYELGLKNVNPYSGIEAMPTPDSLRRALDAADAAHVKSIYISSELTLQEEVNALAAAGYAIARRTGEAGGISYARLVRAPAAQGGG